VFEQLNFITELISSGMEVIHSLFSTDVTSNSSSTVTGLEKCGTASGFQKLKFVDSEKNSKNYLDDYEEGVISN